MNGLMPTNTFHYFLSTGAEWRTGTDLVKLLAATKKANWNSRTKTGFRKCNVWIVPLPNEGKDYEINLYAPQAPGSVWLFEVDFKDGITTPTENLAILINERMKQFGRLKDA